MTTTSARLEPGRRHVLTVDVEDYFQVEAFTTVIERSTWDSLPCRVERNTEELLELFADAGVVATFFTLGWVAQRYPTLVRRMVAAGHELASHGFDHRRADQLSSDHFRDDVRRSKALLEDTGGVAVLGYRAPTFSVGRRSRWAHAILAEEGYRYSSSVYPIAHDLYGEPDAPRFPFRPVPRLIEVPATTVRLLGRNLPAAGGGFFRLMPYRLTRWVLRKAEQQGNISCVFYLHPWEIDPNQPRPARPPIRSQFRHYVNLGRTKTRLRRLLQDFRWTRMDYAFLADGASTPPLITSWLDARHE